eukprot:1714501-Amphidinium_carterae.1
MALLLKYFNQARVCANRKLHKTPTILGPTRLVRFAHDVNTQICIFDSCHSKILGSQGVVLSPFVSHTYALSEQKLDAQPRGVQYGYYYQPSSGTLPPWPKEFEVEAKYGSLGVCHAAQTKTLKIEAYHNQFRPTQRARFNDLFTCPDRRQTTQYLLFTLPSCFVQFREVVGTSYGKCGMPSFKEPLWNT